MGRESGVGGGSKREMKSRDENGGVRRQPGEKRGGENEQE